MATKQKLAGEKLLKKISIRTIVGSKPDILAIAITGRERDKDAVGELVPIMRVLGQVSGYTAGESDFGSFVKLRGNFQATNLITGEVVDSATQAILPDVVSEPVALALKGGAQAAEFAVEIDVQFVEKAATMYEFSARSLIKPQTAAPIAGLLSRLAESGITMTAPKQLAAPKLSDEDKAKQAAAEAAADKKKSAPKTPANA